MTLPRFAMPFLTAALVASTALAQAPEAGTPREESGLPPFDPEALATPPPSWRTPPPVQAPPQAAQPAPEPQAAGKSPASAQTPRTWYGWNFCLIDPLALGAMGYGFYGNRFDMLFWGTTVYLLNGPLIHILLHGRFLHAAHSFGYRLLAPLASLLMLGTVVVAIGQKICSTDVCTRNQIVAMVGLGAIAGWGSDVSDSLEPGDPPPFKISAAFGTTDRGTLTAGVSLSFH